MKVKDIIIENAYATAQQASQPKKAQTADTNEIGVGDEVQTPDGTGQVQSINKGTNSVVVKTDKGSKTVNKDEVSSEVDETASCGATGAGAVAAVPMSLGKTKKRHKTQETQGILGRNRK